ncbi:MAG TPA: tRNA-specific adenosine deaminase, partial [Ginsengibacter sp.]|nr:tRNA-specific adenosine deaminase [Ginsengibacter sp.]
ASCEPCPMCLGAIYWARPKVVYYAGTKDDAAKSGFDDSFIYREIELPHEQRKIPFLKIQVSDALEPFRVWDEKSDKKEY